MNSLSATELQVLLEQHPDSPPLLLDVREPWEFDLARIEGAVNVPMGTIPSALAKLDPARETVVICHHGMRSAQVCHYLQRSGFQRVLNLSGGVDAWSRDVDPSVASY